MLKNPIFALVLEDFVETFHFSSGLLTILSYDWLARTVIQPRIVIYFPFNDLFIG